jgi:5-methylcytosine-specific restriction endonuclease McrA
MTNARDYTTFSDRDLLAMVHQLAGDERRATARLIASLAELDARRLYLGQGCSSLFTYCIQVLHLSEHAAYLRIEAARAARTYPVLLERLDTGEITLTVVSLVAPHLTPDNYQRLVDAARYKSKRDVEQLVACLRPQPPVASVIRKLPQPVRPAVSDVTPVAALVASPESGEPVRTVPVTKPALVTPLDSERYKVQFTVNRDTFEKLRRVRDLMRHVCADGDVAIVFERALTLLLEHLERTKLARVSRPRQAAPAAGRSRRIPADVRRAVWTRDGGQCAFVGACGRCTERGLLEFHHVVPFAEGGAATVENIQLRCRAHNHHESVQWFGGPPWRVRECGEDAGWSGTRSGPS